MSLRQEEQREGPWGWPALQLCAAVLRAQGPIFPSVDIATCLEQILMSLPSPHASYSEELQARGRSGVDAEIGTLKKEIGERSCLTAGQPCHSYAGRWDVRFCWRL